MATYYLSPNGNDNVGLGTIESPWFTLERAWNSVQAGDTIYLRGGTYYYAKTQRLLNRNGTAGNTIKLWNYPGEHPIIRPASGWVYDGWYYGIEVQGNYIHIKGLEVCYFTYQQTSCCRGLMASNVNNCTFERIDCHHNELGMMLTGTSHNNLIYRCDFYENYDPYSNPPYNNGDGLDVSSIPKNCVNTIRECRAWYNADDGFDFFNNEGIVYAYDCWTWMNGYQEDHVSHNQPPTLGNDGNGFKLGQTQDTDDSTRRYLYRCIGAMNRINNFSHNVVDPQVLTCEVYNCLSFGALENNGYQFDWGAQATRNTIIRNCIAYLNNADLDTWIVNDHNSWNTGFSVSANDFVSLDHTQLIRPRNTDGSLPNITFGRLADGSNLIDAGVNIGQPYSGEAPDLGPFEVHYSGQREINGIAFNKIYELNFWDLARCPWGINFFVPNYFGDVEILRGSGHPLTVEFTNGDDDVVDPFRPTQVKIEIQVGENWKFSDLFDPNIMNCWVEVYQGIDENRTLFFRGWVDPSQYEEPYDVPPYYLTITVVDGLTYLQDIMFAVEEHSDGTFTYYEDRALESEIIYDIFSKIGITEYEEFINLYEDSMAMGPTYTPINQLLLERDRFFDMTCADVLTEILRKYGAVIRQNFGILQIFRPVENWRGTIYGRHWMGKSVYDPIAMNTTQYIHRTTTHQESALRQVPGGVQMRINPAKRVNINLEYGNRDTWLNNHNFHVDSYDLETRQFRYWYSSCIQSAPGAHFAAIPISDKLPREQEGVGLRLYTSIRQTFGHYARTAPNTELFLFEFEYGFYSLSTQPMNGVFASFSLVQTAYDFVMWQNNGKHLIRNTEIDNELYWVATSWQSGPSIINTEPMDNVGYGWTGWHTASYSFKGMPYNRPLTITFINRSTDMVYVCIRNVKFSAVSTEISKITYKQTLSERLGRTKHGWTPTTAYILYGLQKLGDKYILKDEYNVVEHITKDTYNPICAVEHGDVKDYDFILGDIVKQSTPKRKGDTGISNNLEQFASSFAVNVPQSVKDAMQEYVALTGAYWQGKGVSIEYGTTSSGAPRLLFKALNPGTDFTAGAVIGTTTGNVSGTAYTIQTNQAGQQSLIELTISGSSGHVEITIEGITRNMIYRASGMAATITAFINKYGFVYDAVGITIEAGSDGVTLLLIEPFGGSITYSVNNQGLTATQTYYVNGSQIRQRIDAIELIGTTGTAALSCNGGSETFVFGFSTIEPSAEWCAGDESSDAFPHKPLLHIIGDELVAQHSRSKYLVQMNIIERITGIKSGLNINGTIIDSAFTDEHGDWRRFIVNRGTFDARHRKWDIDLMELLPYDGVQPEVEIFEPSYASDEDPLAPSSGVSEPSSEYTGLVFNHIDTIPDGRVGQPLTITFEYSIPVDHSENIRYYFSSDYAGQTAVTAQKTLLVNFIAGTHTASIARESYPVDTAKYLQIFLEGESSIRITSNRFNSVQITLNSIATLDMIQSAGDPLSPFARFNATISGGALSIQMFWRIRNSMNETMVSGSQTINFTVGTNSYTFNNVNCPYGEYDDCTFTVGFSTTSIAKISNSFSIQFI